MKPRLKMLRPALPLLNTQRVRTISTLPGATPRLSDRSARNLRSCAVFRCFRLGSPNSGRKPKRLIASPRSFVATSCCAASRATSLQLRTAGEAFPHDFFHMKEKSDE